MSNKQATGPIEGWYWNGDMCTRVECGLTAIVSGGPKDWITWTVVGSHGVRGEVVAAGRCDSHARGRAMATQAIWEATRV